MPLDMKVAKRLHRRIEHFIIPKKLRINGKKKPGLVFRDQDELPTSGDLSMNIQNALEHSEFLIVICTPETRKSQWVLQEISYFLKHHDRDHVLAVLADGTPEESFPPQLTAARHPGADFLTGENLFSENPDMDHPEDSLSETIEPLAANIAADTERRRSRLFRTESLRILAALIGCSYDELYRREQRYRAGKMAAAAGAVMAVAALVIGILLNRNAVIRANYEQSLRNQSVYLAEESINLLEGGDRLSAVALALEALPSDEKKRPYVSNAEYALGCAAGIYVSEGNASGLTGSGSLPHSTDIRGFWQNRKGDILCTVTSENMVTCWDTGRMKKTWEKKLEMSFSTSWGEIVGFYHDRDPVFRSDSRLYLMDGSTGEAIWTKNVSDLTEDSFTSFYQAGFSQDTDELIAFTSSEIIRLDAADGEIKNHFQWPMIDIEGEEPSYTSSSARVSEDGKLAAVTITYGSYPDSCCGIAVIDLLDGSVSAWYGGLPDVDTYIPNTYVFPDSDHVIFITSDMSGSSSTTLMNSFHLQTYSSDILNCLDLNTGKIIWTSEHRSSFTGGNHVFLLDQETLDRPVLAYGYANHLDILDPADGTVLGNTEFYSGIVSLDSFNDRIVCVTEGGQEGFLDPEDPGTWVSKEYFVDQITQAEARAGNVWVLSGRNRSELIHYTPVTQDPSWQSVPIEWAEETNDNLFLEDEYLITNGCLALLDGDRLLVSDGTQDCPVRELRLPQNDDILSRIRYYLSKFRNGILYLAFRDAEGVGMLQVDPASLRYRTVRWQDDDRHLVTFHSPDEADSFYALCASYEKETEKGGDEEDPSIHLSVCVLDDDMQITGEISLGTFTGIRTAETLMWDGDIIYLYLPETEQTFRTDIRTGKTMLCPEELTAALEKCYTSDEEELYEKAVLSRDHRRMALETAPGSLCVFQTADGSVCRIPEKLPDILTMTFTPDGQQLLTLDSGGTLCRFSAKDGTLLGRTSVYRSGNLYTGDIFLWQFPDKDFCVLTADKYLNFISLRDWAVFAYVPNCFGYIEETETLPCYSYISQDRGYGTFRRYTTEELQKYAQTILNGWELSPEQRLKYGLNE